MPPGYANRRIPYSVLVQRWIRELATRYYGQLSSCFAPPVDVHGIATWLGIEVESFRFSGRVSGCLILVDEKWVIGVDSREPLFRQRFTIGHEIAHYVFDSAKKQKFYCKPLAWRDMQERRADYFAANLLMPPEWVCKLYRAGWDVDSMAEFFRVSKEAVRIQLRQLRLVNVA